MYQYLNEKDKFTQEELIEILTKGLILSGFRKAKIIFSEKWGYFSRYTQENINAGYPWKIMDFQGENNTYYIGSSVCFESVNAVVSYNNTLIKKFI